MKLDNLFDDKGKPKSTHTHTDLVLKEFKKIKCPWCTYQQIVDYRAYILAWICVYCTNPIERTS